MKMNKRGMHPAVAIFGVIIGVIVLLAVVSSVSTWFNNLSGGATTLTDFLTESHPVHDLATTHIMAYGEGPEKTYLKPVSYIIGNVPQAIVDASSPIGAVIIIALVFAILVLMFGDILTMFGSFESEWISWMIGVALAIIAANLKVVMLFAAAGFMLVSGAGVLAAILGVLVPFLLYIVVHLMFLSKLKDWARSKRGAANFRRSMVGISEGVKAAKGFSKAVREPAP
tara:strand:- start:47 stop:727 length:681 start_codon:yes stop_codon:yes gene_type:complete